MIEHPPPGSSISKKRLLRRVNAILLFVVHPTQPLDPSNPRTKPNKIQSGGGIRPAYWYLDLKRSGTVGRGQPPKSLLGRKTKADVVIECSQYKINFPMQSLTLLTAPCDHFAARAVDRDLVDIATGRTYATKVYNNGRVSS